MTDEERAFLAAIRAHPSDRTPRLVYADWLEDRSDPRAGLVRVCEAMRRVPVFSDEYWQLKARRNELWPQFPPDWLEATGYDGSDYDPIFRDGVPDDWKGRWRLVREFVERWQGISTPDVGGWPAEADALGRRLGVALPLSVRELVAFAHDFYQLENEEWHRTRYGQIFHSAGPWFRDLPEHRAVGLIYFSLDSGSLGVRYDDLEHPDPPAYFFRAGRPDDSPPGPSLSLAVFSNLFIELPAAGDMETWLPDPDAFLGRLTADFPVHARFDDTDIFEAAELMVVVHGSRSVRGNPRQRLAEAVVRRPIPRESVPAYLFGADDRRTMSSGLLLPEAVRREYAARQWVDRIPESRWMSPVARAAMPPRPTPPPPLPPLPTPDGDIPF